MDIKQQATKEDVRGNQTTKQQQANTIVSSSSSPPSSLSSSPSHDFSFTISLHSSSTAVPDKATRTMPSYAIDLSPADDIFFHGHLLPLQILSHLPISPRSSTNSLDSFSLPIKDLFEEPRLSHDVYGSNKSSSYSSNKNINHDKSPTNNKNNSNKKRSGKVIKSISLLSRWRKGSEVGEREKDEEDETMKKKRKSRFNVSHIFRRYIRIIRPLLVFRGGRREKAQLRRQPYSFSGNLAWKGKQELRGRRGEHSAPASMWTSPTNSGLLVASPTLSSSKSDSTMEELQSAIQAAIAHCKNSISIKEEKLKC